MSRGANMEVAELPAFELDAKAPLQRQIYEQLVRWVGEGRLTPGLRLPASRKLCEQLNVSRNTVTAAIDQLRAEGSIESQTGRGNFIAADLPLVRIESVTQSRGKATTAPGVSAFARRLADSPQITEHQTLPFTPGMPDLLSFPHSIWQRIQRRHDDRGVLMGYGYNQALPSLRESLATYLRVSRGVRCTSEQVLVTQGAQEAISLCSQLLLQPGDTILHENPGYNGSARAFSIQNPNTIEVPLLNQAVNVEWIIANSDTTAKAKLLYTCPTHQYPMGGLLPAGQRLALLDWVQQHGTWVVEDDYDSEFHFLHKPVAALQGMTANNNVIYMGSFSKTFFPALRLGYLVLPESLVSTFTTAKSCLSGQSPLLAQATVADFITEGHFVRHLRRMRNLYSQKWPHFEQQIRMELGDRVEIIAESAGMHLVLAITGVDDKALVQALRKKGFGSSALSSYYLGDPEQTGLVLGFANTTEAERCAVVLLLKRLLLSLKG